MDFTARSPLPAVNYLRIDSMIEFDAFLTHDDLGRENHSRVARVNAALKAAGYSTWCTRSVPRGDANQKTVADSVEKSACLIVFLTRSYIEKASGHGPKGPNDSCKFEFDVALSTLGVGKTIAVVMEPRCCYPPAWPGGTVRGKRAPPVCVAQAEV